MVARPDEGVGTGFDSPIGKQKPLPTPSPALQAPSPTSGRGDVFGGYGLPEARPSFPDTQSANVFMLLGFFNRGSCTIKPHA